MRDLRSNILATHSLAPAARTNGTANGASADMQGFNSLTAIVHFGTWTDGTHTPSLQESDDNSAFTAVATADLLGSFSAVSGSGGNNTVQEVAYRGAKRYVRVVMVTSGATTGALSSAVLIRSKAAYAPV